MPNIGDKFIVIDDYDGSRPDCAIKGDVLEFVTDNLVFKKRQQPLRNGKANDEVTGKKMSSTMAFAWFVWEIGYTGRPTIKWL